MPVPTGQVILAIDPGQSKCGLAVVRGAAILHRHVATGADLTVQLTNILSQFPVDHIVVGDGTRTDEVVTLLRQLAPNLSPASIDESHSTLEARRRYFDAHPLCGWRRWVPLSMQVPPEPYDDFAAVVLAERYVAKLGENG